MLPQAAQRLSEALAEAPGMEEGEKVVEMKQHVIQLNLHTFDTQVIKSNLGN